MREFILSEIRRIAASNEGNPPGSQAFATQTGIKASKWSGVYWSKWSDALVDAGFAPNEWSQRRDTKELALAFAQLSLRIGHVPTVRELQILRRNGDDLAPSPKHIGEHFGGRHGLLEALRKLSDEKPELEKLRYILPAPSPPRRQQEQIEADGWVYLIKSGSFYKIGRSDELERRVREITIALPDKATLMHSIRTDDPSGIEAYWHRRFADRRANGEWFKLSATDVKAFIRRKFQ